MPRNDRPAARNESTVVPDADRRSAKPATAASWERAGWERDAADATTEGVGPSPQNTQERDTTAAPPKRRQAPEPVTRELHQAVGLRRGARLEQTLMEASKAYERGRHGDALRMLRPLIDEAADVAAVRELAGLCLYQQEKWAAAITQLNRFVELTGSVEQNPVLADCHRALRHYRQVEALWEELSASSPAADLVAEGRIVMAGALGDQGKLEDAIRLLERGPVTPKRAKTHHLRLWYALADLYERAGDVPRARELFKRIRVVDPAMADVDDRLRQLG